MRWMLCVICVVVVGSCGGSSGEPVSNRTCNAPASDPLTARDADYVNVNVVRTLPIEGNAWAVALSRDGTLVAGAGPVGVVRIWNVDTGERLHDFQGSDESIFGLSFSPDGQVIAAGGGDDVVRLWSLSTQKVLAELSGHDLGVCDVAFSPDGTLLASVGLDGRTCLWRTVDGAMLYATTEFESSVDCVAWSPAGDLIATGSVDGKVRLWEVSRLTAKDEIDPVEPKIVFEQGSWVRAASFSADGSLIAYGGAANKIDVRNVATTKLIHSLAGHGDTVTGIVFSPDREFLYSVGENMRVWSVATGLQLHSESIQGNVFNGLAINADGSLLATASTDGLVNARGVTTLWQTVTAE